MEHDKAKSIAICSLSGALILFLGYLVYVIQSKQSNLNQTLDHINKVADHIDQATNRLPATLDKTNLMIDQGQIALKAFKDTSDKQFYFIEDQERKFNDPKTQQAIGIALRLGKPAERLLIDAQNVLSSTTATIVYIRETSIPRFAETTTAANASLQEFKPLIVSTTKTINDLDARLNDQRMEHIFTNADVITGNLGRISKTTADDLPKFFDSSNEIAVNVAGITLQTKIAFENFNKPLTFRQKLARSGEEFIFRSAPIIIPLLLKK